MAEPEQDKPEWAQELQDAVVLLSRSKGGIRIEKQAQRCGLKMASELGTKRVTYFRGRDYLFTLLSLRKKHPVYLQMISAALGRKVTEITNPICVELMETLLRERIISRAKEARICDSSKPRKWPERLVRAPPFGVQQFEPDDFYIVNFEKDNPYHQLYAVAIVFGIVFLVLAPVWPLWLKMFLWYSSVLLTVGLWACIFIRLLLFIVLWVIGFEFWILPNIFEDTVPWNEAHRPFVSFTRTALDEQFLLLRSLFFVVGYAVCVEFQRTGLEFEDLRWPIDEIIEWGVLKISPPVPRGNMIDLPKLEDLLKEEAKEAELRNSSEASSISGTGSGASSASSSGASSFSGTGSGASSASSSGASSEDSSSGINADAEGQPLFGEEEENWRDVGAKLVDDAT